MRLVCADLVATAAALANCFTRHVRESYDLASVPIIVDMVLSRPVACLAAILFGAGASISSGMPSAERCIWEWKREIFVTNNPALRETVGELSLPGTRTRIQKWLDQRGRYPDSGDDSEYSFYAKECYLTSEHRRKFFQAYVQRKNGAVFGIVVLGGAIDGTSANNEAVLNEAAERLIAVPANRAAEFLMKLKEIGLPKSAEIGEVLGGTDSALLELVD
jgi:hypothetical protein